MQTLIKLNKTLLFIVAYVVFSSIGTILSQYLNMPYVGEIIIVSLFTIYLFGYLRKNSLTSITGLCKVSMVDVKYSLYYIPLFILVLSNGIVYFNSSQKLTTIIKIIVYMAFVAFLEETLFRGMLIKAINNDDKQTKKAILISSLTFGFGHIVNLLNGYTAIDQVMQIVLSVVIGGVLSMLFIRTKSIIPCIIFHFLFNVASALSVEVCLNIEYILLGIILIVSSAYLLYLCKVNRIK